MEQSVSNENENEEEKEAIEFEGVVTEVYQGGHFLVEVEREGLKFNVKSHLAGRLRRFRIRVVLGDKVKVEVSRYDITKGRITFRHK
jgi:translation initiation factor IF-1